MRYYNYAAIASTAPVKPLVDSPATLDAAQAAVPGFGMSVGRGKRIHFSLHADADGRIVITVVGASPAHGDNQVPTSVTLDAATGEVIETHLLPS